jgi:hypothetical protein
MKPSSEIRSAIDLLLQYRQRIGHGSQPWVLDVISVESKLRSDDKNLAGTRIVFDKFKNWGTS